jgi:hypothetical protein
MSELSDEEKVKGCLGCLLFPFLVFIFIGWILNFVAFCKCDFEAPYKAEIIRGIGIVVAPYGGIVGWVDIQDGPQYIEKTIVTTTTTQVEKE